MEPTPIPQTSYEALGAGSHRSAWGTWFETANKYSIMNSTYEVTLYWRPTDYNVNVSMQCCIVWPTVLHI